MNYTFYDCFVNSVNNSRIQYETVDHSGTTLFFTAGLRTAVAVNFTTSSRLCSNGAWLPEATNIWLRASEKK